jgi:hypothetical protein
MPKFMVPKSYSIDGFALVSIDPKTPTVCEVSFHVGNELRSYHLGRPQLEQLARDIAAKLKAAPLPARRRSTDSSPTTTDK